MQKIKPLYPAILSMLCVIGMLISWRTDQRDLGRFLTYIASTSYIAVAVLSGAHRTTFGKLILLGVSCCWVGDIIGPKNFLAGAAAFLIGHVFFIPAFFIRGTTRKNIAIGFVLYTIISATALAIIGPQIPQSERALIFAYTAVIGIMGATSIGTWSTDRGLPIAAAIFYTSDLLLAQTAFLDGGFINTLFGYPLYYLAVILFAYSPNRYKPEVTPSPVSTS